MEFLLYANQIRIEKTSQPVAVNRLIEYTGTNLQVKEIRSRYHIIFKITWRPGLRNFESVSVGLEMSFSVFLWKEMVQAGRLYKEGNSCSQYCYR